MLTRGLALGAVLGLASAVQAGTNIRLVPQNVSSNAINPIGHYLPGEVVNVNVYVNQTGAAADHLIRLTKLHFDSTSPQLTIGSFTWSFQATGHYLDANLAGGPAGVAAAYFFENAANLGPNTTRQILMPGSGTPVQVGSFQVTMPAVAGPYTLDVVNAAGASTDVRAAITYGFGCAVGSTCDTGSAHADDVFPVTTDRPGAGLTGGTLSLVVNTPTVIIAGEPSTPPVGQTPFTHPLDGGNLWKAAQQVIRIKFNTNIAPAAGPLVNPGIEIRELLVGPTPATGANFAGGLFGANLNAGANFAFSVENDPGQGGTPRILRIADSTPTAELGHRKWFTVQNLGGFAGAAPFRMDYRHMVGDADNNGFVNATDVTVVNTNIVPGLQADNRRHDITGERFVNAGDVTATNNNIPTGGFLAKPAGHP